MASTAITGPSSASPKCRWRTASIAGSETISPPSLMKRLSRPLKVTRPSAAIATRSPVRYQDWPSKVTNGDSPA